MTAAVATKQESPIRRFRNGWNGLSRPQQWAGVIPIVVLIYFIPVINPPFLTTEPNTNFPIAMFHGATYALVAVGLNVVVGQAGLLDLGYIGFYAVGAYVAALFTSPTSILWKVPYLGVLPIAMLITMVAGVILGTPTLRLRGDYLAIVTLGFGEIVRLLATVIPALQGQTGFSGIGAPPGHYSNGRPIFAVTNGTPWYWLICTIIIAVLLLVGNLERSRVGRAWIAIREDEDAAEIMGVPTYKFKLWAFAIGAAIGGLSGALFAGQNSHIDNQTMDVPTSALFVAAVVLGGSGNKVGVMIGGFLISYIPDRFTNLASWKYLIFGVILIVLMIFRPQGLLGARQRLLAHGRNAYQRLVGKPEQLSSDSSVAPEKGAI